MKRAGIVFFLFLIIACTGKVFGAPEIARYIPTSSLMVYAPSFTELVRVSRSLMQRFYGNNFLQMETQFRTDFKTGYGVDVFDLKALEAAGFSVSQPLAYVHIGPDSGFLLLPAANIKKAEAFIKANWGGQTPYRVMGGYIALSESASNITAITNLLEKDKSFELTALKTGFKWDTFYVWTESRYFSEISQAVGVTAGMNLPKGFTAAALTFNNTGISARVFAGAWSEEQTRYISLIRNVTSAEKFYTLDHIQGYPALTARLFMNVPMAYKFLLSVDRLNMLGISGFVAELWQKYRLNVERDIIYNSDGRVNLVVDTLDETNRQYKIYGSMGVLNLELAAAFVSSLRTAVEKSGGKLYSFDLFTSPFYHYKSSNYSIYYGLVQNEIFFSTDKDTLVALVKDIFESRNGALSNYPPFLRSAVSNSEKGLFLTLDVQGFFANVKSAGITLDRNVFVGVKDINVLAVPDTTGGAGGWNIRLDILYR